MLDQNDLQAIAQMVKQVVSDELAPIKQDIKDLQDDVKSIKKTAKRIEGKIDAGFAYLDTSIEKVDRRLAYKTTMLNKTDIAIMQDMENLRV